MFKLFSWIPKIGDAANSVIKTVAGSKQERDQQSHNEFTSTQQAFVSEFKGRSSGTWWDSLWDGFNRMPRPLAFILVMGYFALSYFDPEEFQVLNIALATIPEKMWVILGGILGFYFSSRHFQRIHETKGKLALSKKAFEAAQARVSELRSVVSDLPAWYRVARSEMDSGVREIVGEKNNPRIVEYHKATDLNASDDETAWCSAFVNWCMLTVGVARTNKANARSWLNWGKALKEPVEGCVVVFERGTEPWQGHVGFFVRFEGDQVLCLGGNQSNEINISSYPKSKVLGYRGIS